MLERIETGSETLRHFCNNWNRKHVASLPAVYLHDIHAYMDINGSQTGITYCPYCGIIVDTEARP